MDFNLLLVRTTWKYVSLNGVVGIRFTGKDDFSSKSIFIPMAGVASGTDLCTWNNSQDCYYGELSWSRTAADYSLRSVLDCRYAVHVDFTSLAVTVLDWGGGGGLQIRPVRDPAQ